MNGTRMPEKRGRGISWRIYRLFRWIWIKSARFDITKVVEYAINNDIIPLTDKLGGASLMEKIIDRKITPEEFHVLRHRLFDLEYIKQSYPQILPQMASAGMSFSTDLDVLIISGMTRGWKHANKKGALSFALLAPEVGKVVAFETSEEITNISAFKKFRLENVQFFPVFNRVKGVKHRKMSLEEGQVTINSLSFLFRTVSDLKMIHKSMDLTHFTSVSTESMESESFRLGNHFIIFGRINGFRWLENERDLSDVKTAEINDPTGSLEFMIRDKHLLASAKGPINNIAECFFKTVPETSRLRLENDYEGHVLILGYWALDDVPWAIKIIPLGNDIRSEEMNRFYRKAYLNIRRKARVEMLSLLFDEIQEPLDETFSKDGKWAYMIEPSWDRSTFLQEVDHNFAFSRPARLDNKINPILKYIAVNPREEILYLADGVEKQIAENYHLSRDETCPKCLSETYVVSPILVANLLSIGQKRLMVKLDDINPAYVKYLKDAISIFMGTVSKTMSQKNTVSIPNLSSNVSVQNFKIGVYDLGKNHPSKVESDIKEVLDAIEYVVINGKEIPIDVIDMNDVSYSAHPTKIVFDFNKHNAKSAIIAENAINLIWPDKLSIKSGQKFQHLQLGKECPLGHEIPRFSLAKSPGLLELISKECKSIGLRELSKTLDTAFQQFAELACNWSDMVDSFLMNRASASDQQKQWLRSRFNELIDVLEKYPIFDENGNSLDIRELREISTEDVIFLILCRQIKNGKIQQHNGWEQTMEFISDVRRETTDPQAMRTGLVTDSRKILKSVALKYTRFRYDRVLRRSSLYNRDTDFYENDLKMLLARAIELDTKKESAYKSLRKADISSMGFDFLCRRILSGDIHSLVAADLFLEKFSKKHPISHKTKVWERKNSIGLDTLQRKKFEEEARRLIRQRNLPDKERIATKEQRQIWIKSVKDPYDSETLERRINSILAPLIVEWKRLLAVKSKTHQPMQYDEAKKEFQLKFDQAIVSLREINPIFRKLEKTSVEHNTVKKFFKSLSQLDSFSQDNIVEILKRA